MGRSQAVLHKGVQYCYQWGKEAHCMYYFQNNNISKNNKGCKPNDNLLHKYMSNQRCNTGVPPLRTPKTEMPIDFSRYRVMVHDQLLGCYFSSNNRWTLGGPAASYALGRPAHTIVCKVDYPFKYENT